MAVNHLAVIRLQTAAGCCGFSKQIAVSYHSACETSEVGRDPDPPCSSDRVSSQPEARADLEQGGGDRVGEEGDEAAGSEGQRAAGFFHRFAQRFIECRQGESLAQGEFKVGGIVGRELVAFRQGKSP